MQCVLNMLVFIAIKIKWKPLVFICFSDKLYFTFFSCLVRKSESWKWTCDLSISTSYMYFLTCDRVCPSEPGSYVYMAQACTCLVIFLAGYFHVSDVSSIFVLHQLVTMYLCIHTCAIIIIIIIISTDWRQAPVSQTSEWPGYIRACQSPRASVWSSSSLLY